MQKRTLESYSEIAKLACDSPQPAMQKWTEFAELLEYLDGREFKNILEIGTLNGGTLKGWREIARKDARFTMLDYGDIPVTDILKLPKEGQFAQCTIGDSHNPDTAQLIKEYAPFDFIFIDGDHTYEGVKKDFEMYAPMLVEGGIVGFHDIVEHTKHKKVGVFKFWAELKKAYPKCEIKEFIDLEYLTDHGIWGGIGTIKL